MKLQKRIRLRKLNKKAQEIATNKTIIAIIVILVIVSVLIFIFKADVLKYLRNLPDYSVPEGETIDNNGNNNNIIPENCEKTADIGKPEGGILKGDERYIYIDNKKTELFVDSDKIKLYQHFYSGGDIDVGIIENEQIKINSVLLDETSESYKKYIQEGLPDIKTLEILEGSKYFQEESVLCKIVELKPPIEITEEDLVKKMNSYINPQGKEGCICRDSCIDYVRWIKKYSDANNFDYTWVLSLMIQESGCDYDASSRYSSYGLMQIQEPSFNDNCKKSFGTAYPFNKIKIGEGYAEKNIECGVKILKSKYNEYKNGVINSNTYKTNSDFSKLVNSCINKYPKYENYKDIDAALRAYNGWGCSSGADIEYVEKIQKIREYLINGVS